MSSNSARKTPQRGRLSDITNIAPLTSSSKHTDDGHAAKGCDTPLLRENARLRKALAQKEVLLQAQKVNMEKLWTKYNQKTKQNKDLILQNGSFYKELIQARNRLIILQHENVQMASTHKAIKAELQENVQMASTHKAIEAEIQAQLAKALDQANSDQKVLCDEQPKIPNLFAKLAESRARRTISSYEPSTEPPDLVKDECSGHSTMCRPTLRRRASLSYKEPSLKTKLRQPESIRQVKSRQKGRIHHLRNGCEEDSITAPAMPCMTEDTFPEDSIPQLSHTVLKPESPSSKCGCTGEDQNCLPEMYSETGTSTDQQL